MRGALITVHFDTAGVRTVQVDKKAVGLYLEPSKDTVVTAAKGVGKGVPLGRGKAPAKGSVLPPATAPGAGATPLKGAPVSPPTKTGGAP